MYKPTIVLAGRDETLCRYVQKIMLCQGWAVIPTPDIAALPQTVHRIRPDLLIIGVAQDDAWQSVQVVQDIHHRDRTLPVILLMSYSSEELAIAALKAGVYDYVKVPFASDTLLASVRRGLADLRVQASQPSLAMDTASPQSDSLMIGDSLAMRQIKAYIKKVANTDCNALITGETGTGKELVALLVHQCSQRYQQPLISINCTAIPEGLLESELFGYERGAFTGAHTSSAGVLQQAEGGTVFFDEIGDMNPYAQAKVLRAIDSREIRRLGGKRSIALNIRLIAATNQDPERLVADSVFRKDLYFRLNVARIHLPPLRDRREDIPLLLARYIQDANQRFGRAVETFTPEATALLLRYEWPGNVRELKNLIEATFVNLPARHIPYLDLPEQFYQRFSAMPQDERTQILGALYATHWNKSKAAQQLHWSRMTLYRKMAQHHIISGGETRGSSATPGAGIL